MVASIHFALIFATFQLHTNAKIAWNMEYEAKQIADDIRRRCFICAKSEKVEVFQEAPAHADECVQSFVTPPMSCSDFLLAEKLRSEKDQRMAEAKELEESGAPRSHVLAKKVDVARLFNALRIVREQDTQKQWAKLYEALGTESQNLAKHGLKDEVHKIFKATEILEKVHPRVDVTSSAGHAFLPSSASSSSSTSKTLLLSSAADSPSEIMEKPVLPVYDDIYTEGSSMDQLIEV